MNYLVVQHIFAFLIITHTMSQASCQDIIELEQIAMKNSLNFIATMENDMIRAQQEMFVMSHENICDIEKKINAFADMKKLYTELLERILEQPEHPLTLTYLAMQRSEKSVLIDSHINLHLEPLEIIDLTTNLETFEPSSSQEHDSCMQAQANASVGKRSFEEMNTALYKKEPQTRRSPRNNNTKNTILTDEDLCSTQSAPKRIKVPVALYDNTLKYDITAKENKKNPQKTNRIIAILENASRNYPEDLEMLRNFLSNPLATQAALDKAQQTSNDKIMQIAQDYQLTSLLSKAQSSQQKLSHQDCKKIDGITKILEFAIKNEKNPKKLRYIKTHAGEIFEKITAKKLISHLKHASVPCERDEDTAQTQYLQQSSSSSSAVQNHSDQYHDNHLDMLIDAYEKEENNRCS